LSPGFKPGVEIYSGRAGRDGITFITGWFLGLNEASRERDGHEAKDWGGNFGKEADREFFG
jgi:hypothetical protein